MTKRKFGLAVIAVYQQHNVHSYSHQPWTYQGYPIIFLEKIDCLLLQTPSTKLKYIDLLKNAVTAFWNSSLEVHD
jgi:hypothetical protein